MSDRIRIGIFIDTFFPMIDGVIMAVDNYAKYLSVSADVTVFTTVVARDYRDEAPYPVVRCHSLPLPVEDYVVPAPGLDIEFWEALSRAELDIVHINSPFTVGRAGARYARRHGVPLVATMHSQFATDFKRTLKADKLVNLALDEIMKVFNAADELWVPNAEVGRVYRSYGGTLEPQVRYNATDMRPVDDAAAACARVNARYGLGPEEKIFLFVGRLVLQKNILFLADAVARLKAQADFPFRMLYVGAGQDEEALRGRIGELGLSDRVLLTGRVEDRAQLADLYARADLFLFPSLYDANSLVQIEAASQHTPTLFLRGAVTAATAEDGVSGYFAENSPEAYADRILEIASDPAGCRRVADGAFRDIYRTWEQTTDVMLNDYRRLIAQKKREAGR